ncbi:MAG: NTP transferase domain-containing protein [Lachnospiraceae bacterium]|nr:NTP transferase domain-containing protein [Lachnospiraceae bacterium]
MELTKKQFDVLAALALASEKLTQRQLEEATGLSLGTVNKSLKELGEAGYVSDSEITKAGLNALEPYRAKRAVFIAAGFGSRLVPVTLNTPKPLVRVNGKRIIDGLLDAVVAAGITEIYIVRGYLGEQFDQLLYKYPMIKFLENPIYNEANNISSSMIARHLLQNAYVFEADLLLSNPEIITKYHYTSDFLGIPMERSDDWCFEVKDGIIKEQKVGGYNCHQMVGISYWNGEDGKKLSEDIPKAYDMPGGREFYWEQVPLKVFKDRYKVAVRECKMSDIVEIDTFKELKAIDKSYDV